jgi:hypothetical protein
MFQNVFVFISLYVLLKNVCICLPWCSKLCLYWSPLMFQIVSVFISLLCEIVSVFISLDVSKCFCVYLPWCSKLCLYWSPLMFQIVSVFISPDVPNCVCIYLPWCSKMCLCLSPLMFQIVSVFISPNFLFFPVMKWKDKIISSVGFVFQLILNLIHVLRFKT